MYSVLIIDDEMNAVRDIESMLKNSSFKFSSIYTARSGNEAKRMLLYDNSIKLILSDINMPECNGLEFLEYVQAQRHDVHVVFITGYAKFEYVHQAMKLGASGFLLKPIKKDEFDECITKVNEQIGTNFQEPQKSNDYNRLGGIIKSIFDGAKCSDEDWAYISTLCNVSKKTHFTVSLIRCTQNIGDMYKHSEYIRHSMDQYSTTSGLRIYTFEGYEKSENICLLLNEDEDTSVRNIFHKFYDTLEDEDKKSIYISISDTNTVLLREQYLHCLDVSFETLIDTDEHILMYEKYKKTGFNDIIEKVHELENSIFADNVEDAERKLQDVLNPTTLKKSNMTLRTVYYIIANSIILTINKLFGEVDASITNDLLSDRNLRKFSNLEDMINFLYSAILINCVSTPDDETNIRNIVEFVNANYMNELTLNDLGKRFCVASNYLSRLFKKETGENFTRYLNNLRIKKACEYLSTGNTKIIKIAELVGYKDIQYFHRVFKKITQMTPAEYRMKERLDNPPES